MCKDLAVVSGKGVDAGDHQQRNADRNDGAEDLAQSEFLGKPKQVIVVIVVSHCHFNELLRIYRRSWRLLAPYIANAFGCGFG